MDVILFVFFLAIFFIGGGWLLGTAIGDIFKKHKKSSSVTYIDRSVHHHHHHHEHKNLTIIDEDTHKKGLGYFSDRKSSK